MPKKEKRKFNFKIGADPEFILTMQNRKVDAKQTMELMLKNKTGFVQNRNGMGFDVKPYGNIGWDGASPTGEVRPNPSNDPQEVVNNLSAMFKAMVKNIKICDISVLSEFGSVGGHIHLEIPKGDKISKDKESTIHKKLASFYLPILMSENKTNLNLRLKQGYGTLNDRRIEEKFKYEDGTPGYTFEFRCPSAEWLTTPKIAKATLSYMAVIYNEALNHPKTFTKINDIIYKSEKQGEALQTLAIMDFQLLTGSILKKAKKYIKKFEMYEDYKEEIEYLFNPKQVIKDKIKAEYNIAIGWGLVEQSIPKKSQILASKKTIQDIAKSKDFDSIKGVININYNDDTNVAMFAETLKDRVAAYNWKLKKSYYLFGMRKGIDTMIAKNLKEEYLTGDEILKTILDKEYTDRLFSKMNQKFNNSNGITRIPTLDFATGKVKDMREQVIMIGIPYNMRVEEKTKPFLNFIWSLEKGDLPKKLRKKEGIIDDTCLPLAEQGEVYKILTKQNTPEQEVIMDNDSYSTRRHQEAVSAVIEETRDTTEEERVTLRTRSAQARPNGPTFEN